MSSSLPPQEKYSVKQVSLFTGPSPTLESARPLLMHSLGVRVRLQLSRLLKKPLVLFTEDVKEM